MKNIIIDNLPGSTTDDELRHLFTPFGIVHSATVVRSMSRKAQGLGFVDMDPPDAWLAIRNLDGLEIEGKTLSVSPAPAQRRTDIGIRDTSPSW